MVDWNLICLSPCILILIALALFAGYAFLDHVYGSQGARMIWPYQIVLFLLCMIAAIATNLALQLIRAGILTSPILIAASATCVLAAVNTYLVRRCIQSAQQVLYASPERKRAAATMMAVMGLMSMILLVMLIFFPTANTAYQVFVILAMATCWMLALNTYSRTRNPLILTTTDLIAGGTSHRWDKVRSYYLAPPRRFVPLILRLKGWFPLTNTVIVPLALDEADDVAALLAERLPGLRYTEQSTSDVGDVAAKLA